ncbi:transcriptional regulator sterile apetala [Phtheirospermum japonicum]|uniref:Transcriptional regulator sterile apetala n=1 Tax=Phtheirospermum japonicum TaxID=374723 RepID=A0A830CVB4_9LAMI|nr:transcriptional regulator sterile apetala [Phtheirospermum japonicum]
MSTPSSSSSPAEVGGGSGSGVRGGGEFEGPSSSRSRMRSSDEVWPEPFVEALALQVAIDASRTLGRLSAAQALFNVFQVCSTWRAISRSDLLWQNLTRRIWNVGSLVRDTWQDEYVYRHRTASNFQSSRCAYTTIYVVPTDNNNHNDGLSCRRLALSDHHLAAGFSNGAVHLYHLSTGLHLLTFYPEHRDRLGRFSSAVSGIVLSDTRLVFATLDGDIHMAVINGTAPLRRAHLGDVVNDGALVDFSGCDRWWVGLYAGVPGHAFRIWNSVTEELVFIGGTLTDPEAVMGWHLLTELTDLIGRVRVTSRDTAVACTSLRVVAFDLQNQGVVLGEEELRRGIIVGSFDAVNDSALITDARGSATVRRVVNLEEVCRFTVRGGRLGEIMGCVNGGYGLICVGGVIRVWEIENGEYLYRFREAIGDISAIIADERYVAAYSNDGTIHIWDFGA